MATSGNKSGAELLAVLPPAQKARRSVPSSLPGETGKVRKNGSMSYVALKYVTLYGVVYRPGDVITQAVAHSIRNIHALIGQRLLAPVTVTVDPNPPVKATADPGDAFDAEATVTAQDATNAALLTGLGYAPRDTRGGRTTITVGTFTFSWSGTAWAAGAA